MTSDGNDRFSSSSIKEYPPLPQPTPYSFWEKLSQNGPRMREHKSGKLSEIRYEDHFVVQNSLMQLTHNGGL